MIKKLDCRNQEEPKKLAYAWRKNH